VKMCACASVTSPRTSSLTFGYVPASPIDMLLDHRAPHGCETETDLVQVDNFVEGTLSPSNLTATLKDHTDISRISLLRSVGTDYA
jgi:hypothetical protein